MAQPQLTPEQIQVINKEKFDKANKAKTLLQGAKLQDNEISKKQTVDLAFKAQFDWYDQQMIQKYDLERKALNGIYPSNAVLEADITNAAAIPPTGRLVPTPPATDLVRDTTAFDGATTTSTDVNEVFSISKQEIIENLLKLGPRYDSGTTPTTSATLHTSTAITPSSTQITFTVSNTTESPVISVGNKFLLKDTSNQTLIKIESIVSVSLGGSGTCVGGTPTGATTESQCLLNGGTWTPPTPYVGTFTFSFLEGTATNISSSATIDKTWSGFNNTSRTNKIDTTNSYNTLLNNLVTGLTNRINERIARLDEQITALTANDDPNKDLNQNTLNNNSKTFLNNYKTLTDISDTGLTNLSNERATRATQITNRINAIVSAYTPLYNKRYALANNRANASYGSLREVITAQQVKSQMQAMADNLAVAIESLNSI